jgi:hypothetical protein
MKMILIAWLSFFSVVVNAEMDMPVRVSSTADDNVGKRLVYAVQEGIEKSSSLHITYDSELSIGFSIVTLEGDRDHPGYFTTYSVTWLWHNPEQLLPYYLTSSVGTCGSDRVESCAHGLVADTHSEAEKIFKLIKAYADSQEKESGSK